MVAQFQRLSLTGGFTIRLDRRICCGGETTACGDVTFGGSIFPDTGLFSTQGTGILFAVDGINGVGDTSGKLMVGGIG